MRIERVCFRVVYFKNQHMAFNSLSKKYEIHIKHKTQWRYIHHLIVKGTLFQWKYAQWWNSQIYKNISDIDETI